MLYMAKYYKKRYRKRYTKKQKSDNKLAKVKTVRRMIHRNIEKKQLFVNWANVTPISTTSGTQYIMMAPTVIAPIAGTQGVGDLQRIGSKISVKMIEFSVILNVTTGNFADIVRIMVVRDKDTNGTQITTSELLTSIGSGVAVTAPYRQSLKQNFEVYYDRIFDLKYMGPAVTVAASPNRTVRFKKYFKTPLSVNYYQNANTGTVADVSDNNISVLMWSANGQASAVNMFTNVIFEDA